MLSRIPDELLDAWQIAIAQALLAGSVLALVALVPVLRLRFAAWNRRLRALTAAAVAGGAVLRWFVAPKWIATIYIGYRLTQQAIDLAPVSHYGAGASVVYHAVFAAFGADHTTLMWTNAVLGVVSLAVWTAVAARMFRSPSAGAAAAVVLASCPLLVRNDTSDANNVPTLLWIGAGLVHTFDWLDGGGRRSLAGGSVLLTMACVSRPEMPLLLPLVVLAVLVAGHAPVPRVARLREAAPVLVMCALLVVPHAVHVRRAVTQLRMPELLPAWGPSAPRILAERLLTQDSLLAPDLYPPTLLVLAVASLVWPARERLRRAALAAAIVPALAVYSLDLCRANMARVHVPAAMLATLLAAHTLSFAWSASKSRWVRAAIAGVLVAGAVPSVRTLWRAANEQTEEAFLADAIARLPGKGQPFRVLHIGLADRRMPSDSSLFTHDHLPAYRFRPPVADGEVSDLTSFVERPVFDPPVFYVEGMRCYAHLRAPASPRPHGDNLQPACAEMRARFRLEPVLQREVPNHGDVWLEYYGDAPTLRLGLYRVLPR